MLVMLCGNNMFFNIIGFDFTIIFNFELLHCDVSQSWLTKSIVAEVLGVSILYL